MSRIEEITRLLRRSTRKQRQEIFRQLREEFPIHPLEARLNAPAEMILEAIARSPDITQRGVRGIIAELAFAEYVLARLAGWRIQEVPPEAAYDFLLEDNAGQVRVQVKLQRLERGQPKQAPLRQGYPPDTYIVETQRTRTGTSQAGQATRPYRFGKFDILAVSLHPSTNDWSRFMYTVADWLLPRPQGTLLKVMQPVSTSRGYGWTDDLRECIAWFRSGQEGRIFSDGE